MPPPPRKAKYVKKDERVQEYLQRWMSPPQSDIDHNKVIDTPRLLHCTSYRCTPLRLPRKRMISLLGLIYDVGFGAQLTAPSV